MVGIHTLFHMVCFLKEIDIALVFWSGNALFVYAFSRVLWHQTYLPLHRIGVFVNIARSLLGPFPMASGSGPIHIWSTGSKHSLVRARRVSYIPAATPIHTTPVLTGISSRISITTSDGSRLENCSLHGNKICMVAVSALGMWEAAAWSLVPSLSGCVVPMPLRGLWTQIL